MKPNNILLAKKKIALFHPRNTAAFGAAGRRFLVFYLYSEIRHRR